MSDEFIRVKPYIPLIDAGQQCEIYPPVKGKERGTFEYLDCNRTHLRMRDISTHAEYHIPFAMIDFISPGGPGAVIRLSRQLEARGNVLL